MSSQGLFLKYATDEYTGLGDTTARDTLKSFCSAHVSLYSSVYKRRPTEVDIRAIQKVNSDRSFPGMTGSLDCMHWEWKNCPTRDHGSHRGKNKVPTLVLEAVTTQDLWIWHSFFGYPGSFNGLNVLSRSPLFDRILASTNPSSNCSVNGHDYELGYYLVGGIYQEYATFIKTIPLPDNSKYSLFATKQESVRKDIERAFDVLQGTWHCLRNPARLYFTDNLTDVMDACIILHNMRIEDQRDTSDEDPDIDLDIEEEGDLIPVTGGNGDENEEDIEDNEEWSQNITEMEELCPARLTVDDDDTVKQEEDEVEQSVPIGYVEAQRKIRNKDIQRMLQNDLIEHIWSNFDEQSISNIKKRKQKNNY